MLSSLVSDLGMFGPLAVLVWFITGSLILRWAVLWHSARRREKLDIKAVDLLLARWCSGSPSGALLQDSKVALRSLDRSQDFIAQDLGRYLGLIGDNAPLIGLVGTLVGLILAFSAASSASQSDITPLQTMSPFVALALKSSLCFLAPALLALVWPRLFSIDAIMQRQRERITQFKKDIAVHHRRGRSDE